MGRMGSTVIRKSSPHRRACGFEALPASWLRIPHHLAAGLRTRGHAPDIAPLTSSFIAAPAGALSARARVTWSSSASADDGDGHGELGPGLPLGRLASPCGVPVAPGGTVLMAHYDVVPATDDGVGAPAVRRRHRRAPVTRAVRVWGRGHPSTTRACVVAIPQRRGAPAFEAGFTHRRHDVLLSFTANDEEVSSAPGPPGSIRRRAAFSRCLRRGVASGPPSVLDEAARSCATCSPGVDLATTAVVGVTREGHHHACGCAVDEQGGHAASPPPFFFPARHRAARARHPAPEPSAVDGAARVDDAHHDPHGGVPRAPVQPSCHALFSIGAGDLLAPLATPRIFR